MHFSIAAICDFNQSLLGRFFLLQVTKGLKKGKEVFLVFSFYGRFLVTSTETKAMPMMRTIMMATIPYMTVVFEARPASGVAAGAAVAAGELA